MSPVRLTTTALFVLATLAAIIQCSGGTAAAGSTSCAALSTCCINPSFPSAETGSCLSIAAGGVDEACQSSLSVYTGASYCGGSSPLGVDASIGTGPGITPSIDSGASVCAALASCCTSSGLSAAEAESCVSEANGGNALSCETALSAYQSAGLCTSGGTGSGTGSMMGTGPGTGTGSGVGTGTGSGTGSGGTCTTFCSFDSDCAATCPPQADVTYCCDAVAHECYQTAALNCPVTTPDAGTGADASMY